MWDLVSSPLPVSLSPSTRRGEVCETRVCILFSKMSFIWGAELKGKLSLSLGTAQVFLSLESMFQ